MNYYWPHRMGDDNWYNLGQPLSTHVSAIAAAGYKAVACFRADGEATTRLPSEATTVGHIPNDEFSDDNGNYVLAKERVAFEAAGIAFYYLPVTGSSMWSADVFKSYLPTLEVLSSSGPVLVHCASGHRSSGYVTAYRAFKAGKCSSWAVQEANRVGVSFGSDNDVLSFFRAILGC